MRANIHVSSEVAFPSIPITEIVKFREMLEERLASKQPPLSVIPDEHKPVIAKLVHERCALKCITSHRTSNSRVVFVS